GRQFFEPGKMRKECWMVAHEIVDGSSMKRALTRITYEIIEQNKGVDDLVFVGIKTRGIYLAKRLAKRMEQLEGVQVPVGSLDITLYRDDRHQPDHHIEPTVENADIAVDITDKHVILVMSTAMSAFSTV